MWILSVAACKLRGLSLPSRWPHAQTIEGGVFSSVTATYCKNILHNDLQGSVWEMEELLVFSDDLEELHFYGDAWIAWVNLQSSWAVASITEPFGLRQGLPSSVPCKNVMAIFKKKITKPKQVFFIPLCCFLILYQKNPAKWRGSRWWNTLIKYIFWSLGLFRILLQWLEKVTINYLDKSVLLSAPSPADCWLTGIGPRRRTVLWQMRLSLAGTRDVGSFPCFPVYSV